jgi:hypothetical protein
MKGIFAVAVLCIGMASSNAVEAQTCCLKGGVDQIRGAICKVVRDKPVRSAVSKTVKRSRCAVQGVTERTRGVMQRSRSKLGGMVRRCCK